MHVKLVIVKSQKKMQSSLEKDLVLYNSWINLFLLSHKREWANGAFEDWVNVMLCVCYASATTLNGLWFQDFLQFQECFYKQPQDGTTSFKNNISQKPAQVTFHHIIKRLFSHFMFL